MTPDPRIVRRVKAIDADLSVEWVPHAERWAVFHAIQMPGRYDESVDVVARALRDESARNGYLFALPDCAMAAREAIHAGKLVFYVTNEDGSYAPLDNRVIEKLRRMDWLRRECGMCEWRHMLKAYEDIRRERLEKERDDFWDSYRKDPVLKRAISNALWGLPISRSVIVPTNYRSTHAKAADRPAPLSHP